MVGRAVPLRLRGGAAVHPLFEKGFLRVAMSDRRNCARPLPEQVARLAGSVDALIMREKDLDNARYAALARDVMAACDRAGIVFIAHGHVEAARAVDAPYLHLPLPELVRAGRPEGFALVGTNVHEVGEVAQAEALGADYRVASPIIAPSCKPLPRRGTAFLAQVVQAAHVPVLALGGITEVTESAVRATGAAGAIRMSGYMRL